MQKMLRILIEKSPTAVALVDKSGVITYVNAKLETLFRYDRKEILQSPIEILLPERFRGGHPSLRRGFEKNPTARPIGAGRILLARRQDGTEFPAEISLTPLEDAKESMVLCWVIDISDRQEAERLLRESNIDLLEQVKARTANLSSLNSNLQQEISRRTQIEQEMRRLTELSQDLICTANFEGYFVDVNPAFETTLGYSRDELLQRPFLDRVHPDDLAKTESELQGLAGGHRTFQFVNRFVRKDGKSVQLEWTAAVENDRVYAIARDITERNKLEEQLRQSQKMEALGSLSAGIAHDFNNVLAIIQGAQYLVSMKNKDVEIETYLEPIGEAVKRGQSITNRMLTFSRKNEPDYLSVSAIAALNDVMGIARHTLPKNVIVEINNYNGNDTVYADKEQLNQVILNLVINASDAMAEGGVIKLGIREPSKLEIQNHGKNAALGYLCITVTDNGMGIDAETIGNIFNPFFTTKDIGKGTGLGLSIVYTIVENHNGWIEVNSQPSEGTTFTIGLPVPAFISPEKREVERGNSHNVGQGQTIMIVDDEPVLVQLLKEVLEEASYKTIQAANGAEALKLFAANKDKLDLIITDIGMPVMSGTNFIKGVREGQSEIPIIVCSGYTGDDEFGSLADHKVSRIMTKPIDYNLLLDTIQEEIA